MRSFALVGRCCVRCRQDNSQKDLRKSKEQLRIMAEKVYQLMHQLQEMVMVAQPNAMPYD